MPDLPHPALDPGIDALSQALAERRSVAPLEAVRQALEEALARPLRPFGQGPIPDLPEKLRRLREKYKDLPVLDPRSADEIVGYDENGMW